MGQTLLWLIIIITQVSPHRVRQSFLSPHVELIQIPMYFMVVVLWWLIHLCSHRSQIYSNLSEAFNGCSTSRYDEVDDLSSVIVNKLHCMGVGMPRIFKVYFIPTTTNIPPSINNHRSFTSWRSLSEQEEAVSLFNSTDCSKPLMHWTWLPCYIITIPQNWEWIHPTSTQSKPLIITMSM